jgi:hypothetical protein
MRLLAFAIAVHVGRIDEVDARIDGGVQDAVGVFVAEGLAPFATHLPGAEADFRNGEAGFAKGPMIHRG